MTKKIILSVLYIFLFLPLTGFCGVKYFEKSDDFSDGITYGLSIPSYKGNNGDLGINTGMIVVACVPERGLMVQFVTKDTIPPDPGRTTELNLHRVSITSKFDQEKNAQIDDWYMNYLRHQHAGYKGDVLQFTKNIAKSYTLIIRFNKTGDVLKFSLKDTAKPIQKILNKCSKKNP
ncbi:MAG: hypothetical protein OEU55_14900 [Desulfobacterales bacterium]|jgi:hypothetical protein|nr:hypothetical protein [Desulfobacterales bacterium]